MTSKHIMDTSKTNHTFSFVSADEMASDSPIIVDLEKENQDLRKRLQACGELMIPFMRALCQEPSKAYIKWPGRVKILTEQIQKVSDLTSVPDDIHMDSEEEEETID